MSIGVGTQPVPHLGREGIDHPVGNQPGKGRILRDGNEFVRRINSTLMIPANESLGPRASAIHQRNGGHVLQEEFPPGQSGTHCVERDHVALIISKFGCPFVIFAAAAKHLADSLNVISE